jgi:hypothetical protein
MLVLKKEMYLEDFDQEFIDELSSLPSEATAIIFDSLCETMGGGWWSVDDVSDYLRFDVQVMSLEEVINDYGYLLDLDDLELSEVADLIETFLDKKTYLLGTFEEYGEQFYIFDQF